MGVPFVQVALHFLNFEGRHLFMSLAQMQLAVIEKFFDYSPEVAKKVLAPMEASLKQSEELAKYMRFCQQIIHTSTNAAELKVSSPTNVDVAPLRYIPELRESLYTSILVLADVHLYSTHQNLDLVLG